MSENEKSYGNKAGYMIFRRTIALFGVGPAYVILVFAIAYYVLCRPATYRAAAPYLRRRFPGISRLKQLWYTYRYYYNFGLCLIDQAAIHILGPKTFKIDFPDDVKLKELEKEGRGIVFLTSHIGIWQQAISTLGFMGRSVYVNIRREYHSQTMGLAKFKDVGVDIHIVSPDGFLGGVPELSAALLRGNLVAVMGDRVYGTGTAGKARFLGDEASFPLLPHHLALSTDSDLVVFLTTRVGKRHFLFEAKIKRITHDLRQMGRDKARSHLLEWYAEILEKHIEKHPFMWYNFIDFWKK